MKWHKRNIEEMALDNIDMINKEREGFRRILGHYLPSRNQRELKILNICCGPVTEEPVLNEFFNPLKLVSVDYSESVEEWARAYGSKSFVRGDISKLDEILGNEKFNFLLGRNIPLSPGGYGLAPGSYAEFPFGHKKPLTGYRYEPVEESDDWLNIFRNLRKHLSEGSEFFLTLSRNDEFYRAQEILRKSGYHIINAGENKFPCPSDRIGMADKEKDYYFISGRLEGFI